MRPALVALAGCVLAFAAGAQEVGQQRQERRTKAVAPAASLQSTLKDQLIPFVDAHVHLNDEAMHLDLMKQYGATRAVVFWGRSSDNEMVAEAAHRHPDRFIP